MINLPVICHETEDFAVVFKPPRMHCAPLKEDGNETLLDWYAKIFPPIMELSGRKENEGGLLHRLDFETQGLVLFAKNQQTLENLLNQQKQGKLIKEYSAICQKREQKPDGFEVFPGLQIGELPLVIESYFRPYGPGRKQVRPVTKEKLKGKEVAKDGNTFYKTEIINIEKKQTESKEEQYHFTVRLKRGFRHQIRCHLAWAGFPVLNDPLYGKEEVNGFLALRATGLFFDDPKSGEPFQFRIEQ
ncbi:MAG: RNA pseudouridine synthase [Treponema sp.]|jgi:23S rRNA pseudouridine1911/1915/1917 synthase|nr:RNA pseudouridine synthase [Treponema sp.]